MPFQMSEDILTSGLQSDIYPGQAEVHNFTYEALHKFIGHLSETLKCMCNVQHMSKQINFIWPSRASL